MKNFFNIIHRWLLLLMYIAFNFMACIWALYLIGNTTNFESHSFLFLWLFVSSIWYMYIYSMKISYSTIKNILLNLLIFFLVFNFFAYCISNLFIFYTNCSEDCGLYKALWELCSIIITPFSLNYLNKIHSKFLLVLIFLLSFNTSIYYIFDKYEEFYLFNLNNLSLLEFISWLIWGFVLTKIIYSLHSNNTLYGTLVSENKNEIEKWPAE